MQVLSPHLIVLALAFLLAAPAPDLPQPLMIKARLKPGTEKEYPTRVLRHLANFQPQPVALSRYGGWLGEKQPATGYFHARKIGSRWWLIDPEGYRYLHIAMNSTAPGKVSLVNGKFEVKLSPRGQRAFPRKFGGLDAWRDQTIQLLRDAGFNGTGSWSADALLRTASEPLAYTPNWNFMSSYGRAKGVTFQEPGHTGYPNRCIPVFDPEFETFADQHARQLAATKDDPNLLGHFSDNEMPFPRDSLDRYLKLAPADPGRLAAERFCKDRQIDPDKLADADREAWLGVVADRYFGVVARAIRRHDPNHMYLGSRFYGSEKAIAPVFAAAGKHLDVISVNVYGVWTPTRELLGRWEQWSGRPVMITEWYAKGDDTGMPNISGAGWTVATQQDRGWFYQNYTLGLLESQVCVGWHWFKYLDNDPDDLSTDPSNRDSNKGILTADFVPHVQLIAAMKELNRAAYPLAAYFDGKNASASATGR